MCDYYAHTFRCEHTTLAFARYCREAGRIQTACAHRRDVWTTLRLDEACEECRDRQGTVDKARERRRWGN